VLADLPGGAIILFVAVLLLVVDRLWPAACEESFLEALFEDVVDERGLARSADAGDADQQAKRDLDVDVLEVVMAGAAHGDVALRTGPSLRRDGDLFRAAEILRGETLITLEHVIKGA